MATGDLHILAGLYVVTLSFCGKFGIYHELNKKLGLLQTSYFKPCKAGSTVERQ